MKNFTLRYEINRVIDKNYWLSAAILAKATLSKQYKDSFLGWLWALMLPALQVAIYAFVFSHLMRFAQDNYIYYLITGVLPWNFICATLPAACDSLIMRGESLKRCVISKTIFPVSDILKNLYNFTVAFSVMYCISLVFFTKLSWMMLLLPLAILPMLIIVFCLSIAISYTTPYLRDLKEFIMLAFNILFFLTPIIYPLSALSPQAQFLVKLNPITWLIQPVRDIMFSHTFPSLTTIIINLSLVIISIGFSYGCYTLCKKRVIYYI